MNAAVQMGVFRLLTQPAELNCKMNTRVRCSDVIYNEALQTSHVPPQFSEHAPVAAVTTLGSRASKNVNTSSPMRSTPKRARALAAAGATTSRMHVTACATPATSRASSCLQPSMRLLNCCGQRKLPAPPAAAQLTGKRGAQGSSSHSATIKVVRRCPGKCATPQPGSTQ